MSTTELKLAKGKTDGIRRVLRVPLVRPSQLVSSDAYYVQVDVGLRAAGGDCSPMMFLSDNRNAVGFALLSTLEDTTGVCLGREGEETFPNGLTQARIVGETTRGSNQSDPTTQGTGDGAVGGNSRKRRWEFGDSDDDSDDSVDSDDYSEDDSDDSKDSSDRINEDSADDSDDDSDDNSDDDSDDDSDYHSNDDRDDDSDYHSNDDSDDDSDDDSNDDRDDDSDDDSNDDSDEEDNRTSGIKGGTSPPQPAMAPSTGTITRVPAHATRLLFKPRNSSWGSCTVPQVAGATNAVMFTLPTNPQNGLFLDIYLGSEKQAIGLRYLFIRLVLEIGPVTTA